MARSRSTWLVTACLLAAAGPAARAQTGATPAADAKPPLAPAFDPKAPAATVNGQVIAEAAVQRGLRGVPPAEHARARAEILDYLIDNTLIDQYLVAQKIEVPADDVAKRLETIKAELKKNGQDFGRMMQALNLTEEEMRQQIAADLRWERFCTARATEKALKDLFEQNVEMFDSSLVRARHILVKGPKDPEAAKVKLAGFKKQAEDAGVAAAAKVQDDPKAAEAARAKAVEDAFVALARENSDCPSKKDGGDLNYFPRAGSMVEPFAKAAFALKPFEVSEPVATPFGYHLIMQTARKAGTPVKFDDVKDAVFSVFCVRTREALLAGVKPTAKVTVVPPKS